MPLCSFSIRIFNWSITFYGWFVVKILMFEGVKFPPLVDGGIGLSELIEMHKIGPNTWLKGKKKRWSEILKPLVISLKISSTPSPTNRLNKEARKMEAYISKTPPTNQIKTQGIGWLPLLIILSVRSRAKEIWFSQDNDGKILIKYL